jgi:hypothetical protein
MTRRTLERQLAPALLLAAASGPALAADDTVQPGELDTDAIVEQVGTMPARGTEMATVRDRLGSPLERMAAVGEPPITRWVYDGFVVYFEDELVLHSVKRVGDGNNN